MAKFKLSWFKNHKVLTALIALFVIGLSYFPVHAYRAYADKQKFNQARTAIDSVYADIVKQVGRPDDSSREYSCSQLYVENVVSQNGPISCDVDVKFTYGVIDREQANQKFKQVQTVISQSSSSLELVGPPASAIADLSVVNTIYHSAYDKYELRNTLWGRVDCSANYIYDTPRETSLKVRKAENKVLQINIGCSASSSTMVYPAIN